MTHPVPDAILNQHVAVLGKTRSGKSSVMRGLVERLLDRGKPVCIVDPKGDWWGVKLAGDGKGAGYPIVIFGGEHADVPINAHAGAHVAELFATGNRSCLIDLGGWTVSDRTKFWVDFASSLFKHTRGLRWLVVDEVHNFCPKAGHLDPGAAMALHWTNRLASEGLGKGLAMLFASQRPQKVHNDTLTSAETLIAMRVLHPSDRDAVSDWVKGCGDPKLGAEVLNSLAQLDRGEGWAWSPEIGFGPKRVKFPMFETYDSFRPQTAAETKGLEGWAEVDLNEVKAKLAIVIKEAEENDPRRLKAEVARLTRELAAKSKVPTGSSPEELKQAREEGYREGYKKGRLDERQWAHGFVAELAAPLGSIQGSAKRINDLLMQPFGGVEPPSIPKAAPPARREPVAHSAPVPHTPARGAARRANGHAEPLPRGEKACLICAAQQEGGATREQMTVVTGYKRSSRDAYIQRLRERGYIEHSGERILATDAGIAALGSDYEPLPSGQALQDYHLQRLPEGERRVLEILIAAYPEAVRRDQIDEATGYKRSSRDAYLQRLSARQLVIVDRGEAKASDELFA